MTNDYLITREHTISLLIVASAILFFNFFPVSGFSQSIIVLGAFLVLFPLLYTRLILRKDFSHLALNFPHFTAREGFAFTAATFIGICWAFFLFFVPYTAPYIDEVSSVITTFKGFVLYELLIILPVVLLATFFAHTFIFVLDLPKNIAFLLSVCLFATICIAMLGLPLISLVFFMSVLSVYFFLDQSNFYLITLSFFISFLTLGTLIAKASLT